jgi:hypothetical protein
MAKTRISNGELTPLFFDQTRQSSDCPPGMHVAIVPTRSGWTAVMSANDRRKHPKAAKRVAAIQKSLSDKYTLD